MSNGAVKIIIDGETAIQALDVNALAGSVAKLCIQDMLAAHSGEYDGETMAALISNDEALQPHLASILPRLESWKEQRAAILGGEA